MKLQKSMGLTDNVVAGFIPALTADTAVVQQGIDSVSLSVIVAKLLAGINPTTTMD
ncbi:hypothetical protein D1AOALGA4SA_8145 [Olavius algarvensis Delta 1 endosymbiont]|nr:hypothetical protein D1AOALGA4SA_8145 [Olavius algarvensis Delta 1 endosymbiont]